MEDRRLLTVIDPYGEGGGDGGFTTPNPGGGTGEDLDFVSGQLIVGFERQTNSADRNAILDSFQASAIRSFPYLDAVVVTYATLGTNVPEQAEQWSQIDGVRYAEPNYKVEYHALPNDILFPQMWALNNTGQTLGSVDADIDAPEAWDVFTGTSDAVVAVVDSGVYYTHPDIADNMWVNEGEIPNDNIDNDGNGYIDDIFGIDVANRDSDPLDDVGHGTHVAGTIGATGNNNIGVTGINWDSSIMAVKAGDASGLTTAWIVESIEYVTTMKTEFGVNVVVSNHSYGGYFPSTLEEDAIRRHTAADIVFVAAAGNDSLNVDVLPHYPAGYDVDGIVAVAATDHNDQLSVFSNYGAETVDIAAPGGSGTGDIEDILSTYPPDLYQPMPGTSMASPHVAGVVALLRGYNSSLTRDEAITVILDTADPLPSLAGRVATGGRLNAYQALIGTEGFEVRGEVWADENSDGVWGRTESPIANWTVYVDLNENGQLDTDEPAAVTNNNGRYVIETAKGQGTYTVAQVIKPKWNQTYPTTDNYTITVSSRTDVIRNIDFGNKADGGRIRGIKWHDLDGDGEQDFNEPGMEGIYIYADLDNSGSIALGEPAAITDEDGKFLIVDVPPGEVIVREVLTAGWTISYPAEGYHTVTVEPDKTSKLIAFGNADAIPDFGDAPAPYPTLLEDGGAWHQQLAGFHLGELVDGEDDGIPDEMALGDDRDNLADEDGVVFPETIFAGTTSTVEVTVTTGIHSAGFLQGWIDFNQDGDWSDAGEQVITDLLLPEGVHDIDFEVPLDVEPGETFTRWRYSYEEGLGAAGGADSGEVEDYQVMVLPNEPIAVDDEFTIDQDSEDNELDVLDNDFRSATGVLYITDDIRMISDPERATVTVAADHRSIFVTPATGVFSPPDVVFEYTISDEVGGGGATDSAIVTVTVESTILVPIAVDDTKYVSPDVLAAPIDVLANDIPGVLNTMEIVEVSGADHGIVLINRNGTPGDPLDDFLEYVPDSTFETYDEFTYTIENANGSGPESIGMVTVFNEDLTDQGVQIDMGILDMSGDPIFEIVVGQEFQLLVTIQDAREVVPNDEWGVFSAYLDVLYNSELVSTIRDSSNPFEYDIEFSDFYSNGRSSDGSLPGILNETGAFQAFVDPEGNVIDGGLGPEELEFFRVTMTANAVGTAEFAGNPADNPINDVLYYDPADSKVPIEDIFYGFTSLEIISEEEGEGSPLDVNRDGYISPWDALQIINSLNLKGFQDLGEGEPGGDRPNYRLDVNRDLMISPYDALMVINYLNNSGIGEGEAEGESGLGRGSLASYDPLSSDLLALESDMVTTLDVMSDFTSPDSAPTITQIADSSSASAGTSDEALSSETDWRLSVGEASDESSVVRASATSDSAWESLLDELGEDAFEAWLDGDDA